LNIERENKEGGEMKQQRGKKKSHCTELIQKNKFLM
jgi:hypothetical protein